MWREQNEKYYLKSLDHQGLLFKQSDVRSLRSKSLLNEIETLYDERHEQQEEHGSAAGEVTLGGPHLTLEYTEDVNILEDANNLLIHHVKRQTSIHKEDKQKIKALLKHFLMDLFKHRRQELSDDEREDEDDEEKEEQEGDSDKDNGSKSTRSERARKKKEDKKEGKDNAKGNNGNGFSSGKNKDDTCSASANDSKKEEKDITEADVKVELPSDGRRTPLHARDMQPGESYSHMMCNNNWYLFFRLHNILCERLTKMYNQAIIIANEEARERKDRKDSTAVALRLKPKSE